MDIQWSTKAVEVRREIRFDHLCGNDSLDSKSRRGDVQ